MTTAKPCTPPNKWVWKDCDIEGHADGLCFMVVCNKCGATERDCEVSS